MADKLIYIPDDDTQITPSVGCYQGLKRFDTLLNEPTNSPQSCQTIKKSLS